MADAVVVFSEVDDGLRGLDRSTPKGPPNAVGLRDVFDLSRAASRAKRLHCGLFEPATSAKRCVDGSRPLSDRGETNACTEKPCFSWRSKSHPRSARRSRMRIPSVRTCSREADRLAISKHGCARPLLNSCANGATTYSSSVAGVPG